jgi:hypothetical protein
MARSEKERDAFQERFVFGIKNLDTGETFDISGAGYVSLRSAGHIITVDSAQSNLCPRRENSHSALQDILYDEHEKGMMDAIHSGQQGTGYGAKLGHSSSHTAEPTGASGQSGFGHPQMALGEAVHAFIYGHVQLFHARTGAKFTAFAVICRRIRPPQTSWVVYR